MSWRPAARGLKVERSPHSVNLSSPGSDLRVQLQIDPRYQDFLGRAEHLPDAVVDRLV